MFKSISTAVGSAVLRSMPILALLILQQEMAKGDELAEKMEKWKNTYVEKILPIMEARCVGCHRGDKIEGEFDLAKYADPQAAVEAGDAWERVAKRIRLNEMPPQGSPGLNDEQKGHFHRWVDSRPNRDLCNQLASEETQSWYQGTVMSRRLTQTEYRNAILDLTGQRLDPNEEPPSDGAGGEGFDTVGDALFTSTIHLESYLTAADRVVEAACSTFPNPLVSVEVVQDIASARAIVSQFARRAWRRPVAQEEIDRLMSLCEKSMDQGVDLSRAIRQSLKGVLVSPHFLFVVEVEPEASGVQRLSPHQLATRLALLIWSSVPDEELLQLADSSSIYDEVVLRAQVRRMLADSRSRAIGENFGLQWLGLRGFAQVKPDESIFPEYQPELAADLREEAILYVSEVFRKDRPLTELISSNSVYINGRLASFYGLDLPQDAPWQSVAVSDGKRGGVITMASVLTSSSYPRRTSPVLRGRWILDELLGSPVPPPPPNVPALEESSHNDANQTMRQRLEIHRQKAECASCHDRMDPLGFGLENYDGIGRWRDSENGLAIDSAGKLPSGDQFSGPTELKSVLMKRSAEFQQHFIRKLLGFALGRSLNKFDACVVEACMKKLNENEMRSQVLIEEIALSYPFQHRYRQPIGSKNETSE